ncbi:unnamed protein product [Adineta steineri]|nr:unnamed protein product [Adineta steineri]CAF1274617.1 unnamed protein product [Adineta steineri]CAF3749671.1 unnamed protein product [Adineta steineri]
MEEYSLALDFHERARQIRQESLPETHPDLAQTRHNLARIYMEMEQYEVAYEHAQRAVEIAQQKLSEKHPDLLEYTETLSELQQKL